MERKKNSLGGSGWAENEPEAYRLFSQLHPNCWGCLMDSWLRGYTGKPDRFNEPSSNGRRWWRMGRNYKRHGKEMLTAKKGESIMEKNLCGKTRKVVDPYEIWVDGDWEWRVLKKYQTPSNEKANPYARWFCAVKSPFTHGSWEYGDVYVKDITTHATKKEGENK